ncbi:hypothetical protein AN958_02673 [Leucoagaricus sp. SymC.cos]|nr:hypothetical protein AN958_02673 [Leucoagaricus sp. SymC.cos]
MPPRPIVKSRDRPTSAIYIGAAPVPGSAPSPAHASSSNEPLPDLPGPPSPVSSVGSGLPSPPATNSTGSGSTGDPASIALRRQSNPMGAQNTQAQTGSEDSSSTRSSSRLSWKHDDPDLDHPLDQDEDQTMRLKIGSGSSNESVLQRARSLAQRNRLQLDKLASGKLGRASPSSSSSPRNQRHSMPDPSQVLSGSETEREGDNAILNSTSTTSSGSKSSTASARLRLSSAPTSPHRARVQASSSNNGTSSPTRRRKRVSSANISAPAFHDNSDDENDDYDQRSQRDGERYEVGTARDRIRDRQDTLRDDRPPSRPPTVNLNSLKKTPLGATRRRSALPREFREGSADEVGNYYLFVDYKLK